MISLELLKKLNAIEEEGLKCETWQQVANNARSIGNHFILEVSPGGNWQAFSVLTDDEELRTGIDVDAISYYAYGGDFYGTRTPSSKPLY